MNAPNSRSRKTTALALTARDLRMLAELSDRAPLPIDRLLRHFQARKTALNRLGALVRAGYLTAERVQLIDRPAPVLFYSPTGKANHVLARVSEFAQRFDHGH